MSDSTSADRTGPRLALPAAHGSHHAESAASELTRGAESTGSTPRGGVRDLSVPDESLIDIRALAKWLSVSESIVRKWTAKGPESGLVPKFIRINGQIRFRPADVRAFLAEREVL